MSDFLFTDSKGREVPAPSFGGALVADTHAHLDMLDDPVSAIARAARAGVGFIATVADVTEDASRTYEELPAWLEDAARMLEREGHAGVALPTVRVIVGAHPHNAKDFDEAAEKEMRRLAADPRTCGLGEMGLDYHYDHSPRDVQRGRFARHLELAHELDLPAVIHLREAHQDGLAILEQRGVPARGAILHCYTLGEQPMEAFLELGCFVSFAGPVTFKKAEEIRKAAVAVPVGRLLTETDCPFMAPEPFRGNKNEPALVVFTANAMAQARNEDASWLAEHTYVSAVQLLDRERQ